MNLHLGVTGSLRLLLLLLSAMAVAACSSTNITVKGERIPAPQAESAVAPEVAEGPSSASPTSSAAPAEPEPEPTPTPSPTPDPRFDAELPKAPIGFEGLTEAEDSGPQPVSLVIEDLPLAAGDVIPVGVNEDLTFEVPPADQIGWYKFGSAPGEPGSAVLAAHIAYDGVDGVFRYLSQVPIGAIVTIGFDDGSSERYRIEELVEYFKDELPDELFAREGKPQLALITCGGDFNYSTESYESNTVAIAVPIP